MTSNFINADSANQASLLGLIKRLEIGLIVANNQGQVLLWNPWMERVTGIPASQALGQSLNQVFSQAPAIELLDTIEQACSQRLSRRLSHQLHPHLLPLYQPSSGEPLHHSILVHPLNFAEQASCLLQIIDVSSTRRREQHLKEAEALLRLEKEVLYLIAHHQELGNVWQALCSGIESLAPKAQAGILLFEEDKNLLTSPLPQTSQLLFHQVAADSKTPPGLAFQSNQAQQLAGQTEQQPAFYWCYPLICSTGAPFGVLQLAWPQGTSLATARLSLLERSAQLAVIAFQNHQQLQQVRHLAQHDVLTGLPNRSLLNEKLEQLCCRGQAQQFSLLFIDLDGFKLVNDQQGHAAGDNLLIEIARRLTTELQGQDLATRLGGDELVVLSQEANTESKAFALAKHLNQCIEQPFLWQGQPLQAGASIGIALFPQHGRTPDELLTQADNAMYLAKSRGKGQAASCDLG